MNRQSRLVYALLITGWALMLVWQMVEHDRVKRAAQTELRNRAKDISTTVGLVLSSQRHVITKERLEFALNSLIKPHELMAVAMLNADGETVASAGAPIESELKGLVPTGEHWGSRNYALMNLVALGTNVTPQADSGRPPIVVPGRDLFNPNRSSTNRSRPPFPPLRTMPGAPPDEPRESPESASGRGPLLRDQPPEQARQGPRPDRERRMSFRRPFWMSPEEFRAVTEKQGVHSFVIVMSTQPIREAARHDLWLRVIISALASVSVVGLALAWSNLVRSGELEVRLVRAAELNTRLREMSFAAAGLAHETKNPLNIIRGLAQMISRQEDASPEVRTKVRGIVDQADQVTAQVNEFINFSRPRELRPAPVVLASTISEVVRALGPDLEEKGIQLQVPNDLPVIEADEQQLRQALFNLLINAIQAMERGGAIEISVEKRGSAGAVLEIRDNGPGIPPEHRSEVFKPYFTTNQKGTGLGLAVVQQIVLAHGWEIECLGREPRGAVFRISHLRLAGGA
jgi:signal transduction histidine kinase